MNLKTRGINGKGLEQIMLNEKYNNLEIVCKFKATDTHISI